MGRSLQFLAHVYGGQTAGWMKLVLGMEVGLSPGQFVLDGDPVPFPEKGAETPSPIFSPFLLWPNGCMHQNATLYGARPGPRRLCVRWGSRCTLPKSGAELHYCGQTAGWMKTSLGTEVDISAGHIVLDGFAALRLRGTAAPPSFRPMSIVATVAHLSYC